MPWEKRPSSIQQIWAAFRMDGWTDGKLDSVPIFGTDWYELREQRGTPGLWQTLGAQGTRTWGNIQLEHPAKASFGLELKAGQGCFTS